MGISELNDLMTAFHSFDGAVIEQFAISFRPHDEFGTGTIVLRAAKAGGVDEGRWFHVTLLISDIKEFRFTHSASDYNLVLSSGLQITSLKGCIFLIFNEDEKIDTVEKASQCSFYVAGITCEAVKRPYPV
jgi:hypothetical protein